MHYHSDELGKKKTQQHLFHPKQMKIKKRYKRRMFKIE